jgi:Zn-dependent protease
MLPTDTPESTEYERLTSIVARVFVIEDITHGDLRKQYLLRYRGHLRETDSQAAYDQLASALKPFEIMPIFRKDGDRQSILLIPGVIRPGRSRTWVNLVLFIITVLSVLFAGIMYTLGGVYDGPSGPSLPDLIPYVIESLGGGVAFAVSLLAILLAHEFGHYLAGRYHKTHVTLPYFIPFPFSAFGTMGAFIQLKEPPRNKRILLDIGIAGPLAGLVVAIPVVIIGLSLSRVGPIPTYLPPGQITTGTHEFWRADAVDLLGALFLHRTAVASGWYGCAAAPGRLGGLGRSAGHRFEFNPRRTARRRSYHLCADRKTRHCLAAFHPGGIGHAGLLLVRLVVVGAADLPAGADARRAAGPDHAARSAEAAARCAGAGDLRPGVHACTAARRWTVRY